MFTLQIVTASTREGRTGQLIADWFIAFARKHGKFNIEPVDLKQVNLPMYNEPRHPRLRQYEFEYTKAWSAIVARADAFVFVTPEYNHTAPPALINAIDYLNHEWAYKPAAFVSYGGVSAGTRSVQVAKQVLVGMKMMPIPEAVNIPFFNKLINDDTGLFDPGETQDQPARAMLDELLRWTEAMKTLRS